MKKIAWWAMTTISATALLLSYPTSHPNHVQETAIVSAPTSSGTTSTTTEASSSGSFTGAAYATPYGPVQVQITTSGNSITSAQAVSYPNSNGKDQMINSRAIPVLNQKATSGSVDTVSGATYTSQAYEKSLQSALDQAGL